MISWRKNPEATWPIRNLNLLVPPNERTGSLYVRSPGEIKYGYARYRAHKNASHLFNNTQDKKKYRPLSISTILSDGQLLPKINVE